MSTTKIPSNEVPPAGGPHEEFWQPKSLEELAAAQGVGPVRDPASLTADFWPDDETADDFVAMVRALRRDGGQGEPS